MIELPSPNAVNAAFVIAGMGPEHMRYVKLSSDGSMYATSGIAAIRSEGTHDTQLFIVANKRPPINKNAVAVMLDLEESQLVEQRPKSEVRHDIEIVKEVPFPSVENIVPSHLWQEGTQPLFVSIVTADIAKSYFLPRGILSL